MEISQRLLNEIVRKRLDREKAKHEKEVKQLKARIAELEGEPLEPEEVEQPTDEEPEEIEEQSELSDEEQDEYKAKYFDALKRKALLDAGFTLDQLDTYSQYVKGDTEDEIERQALELSREIKGESKYADPNATKTKKVWNFFG
ncbi:hypothetical protein ACFOZ1_07940 [Gracilibacillus marinus]|uniref:DUF4355 domain-containing protein n=1 Tax=Gracilibacillus marinus TaxID=630535 RepID=A0ABV8VU61_9BACI